MKMNEWGKQQVLIQNSKNCPKCRLRSQWSDGGYNICYRNCNIKWKVEEAK